jgi:hypothetical protein
MKQERNLLRMRPLRVKEWYLGEESKHVHIAYPKLRSRVGKRFGTLFGIVPTYAVKLDQYGSAVWELCDGGKTVEQIGKAIEERFGEKVEPLYPRLSKFLELLERSKLIRYEE